MISSLSEVKAYLGITSSSEDSFLQSLLDSTEAGILAYLGYTTLSTVNITAERHKPTYTKDPVTGVAYYLDEINPHGTVTINAVAPTKFEITGSRLFVLDWSGSLDDFGKVSIGYEAGYATIPADIKLAQNLIVADKRGKRKAG